MISVVPCGHRVVVRQHNLADKDKNYAAAEAAGIIVAATEQKREQGGVSSGQIIAIGPSAWVDFNSGPWAEVGDNVVFALYAGKVIKTGEGKRDYVIVLNDADIVAVLKDYPDE